MSQIKKKPSGKICIKSIVIRIERDPFPHMSHFLRQADLCYGATTTEEIAIDFRHKVTKSHCQKVCVALEEHMQSEGFEVHDIEITEYIK